MVMVCMDLQCRNLELLDAASIHNASGADKRYSDLDIISCAPRAYYTLFNVTYKLSLGLGLRMYLQGYVPLMLVDSKGSKKILVYIA